MLRNSFYQFQADRAIPDLEKQVKALEEERDSMIIEEEDSLKNYYNLIQQYKCLKNDIRDIVFSPKYCLPYMKSGRPVCIRCIDDETSSSFSIEDHVTWGVLMDFHRVKSIIEADDDNKRPEDASYALDILTRCNILENLLLFLCLSQVTSLSSARLTIPKDLLPVEARENALKKLLEFISRHPNGMPLDTDEKFIATHIKRPSVGQKTGSKEVRGKVACEISSADELTLTELMFSGVLKDVKAEEMVSLLSCFVWQEKLQDAAKPREELELLFTQLQDTAQRIAKVQLECKEVFIYRFKLMWRAL
ncbi:hypothetical protein V6N13_078331 [Hibiscus sabdariffa]